MFEYQNRTLCNRLTSTAIVEFLAEGCSTLNAGCSRWFKGQVITTPAAMADAFDVAKAKRIKRAEQVQRRRKIVARVLFVEISCCHNF